MKTDAIRFQIMSQATEDMTGPWELAATPQRPGIEELVDALAVLIRDRLVTVYRGTHFTDDEKEEALSPAAARKEIQNRQYWDWSAADRGPHLRISATAKGREWYFSQRLPPADASAVS